MKNNLQEIPTLSAMVWFGSVWFGGRCSFSYYSHNKVIYKNIYFCTHIGDPFALGGPSVASLAAETRLSAIGRILSI